LYSNKIIEIETWQNKKSLQSFVMETHGQKQHEGLKQRQRQGQGKKIKLIKHNLDLLQ
jgi:hypothetical protein